MQVGGINFSRDHGFENVHALPIGFEGNFKLWRYMSLPKFLKFLEDRFLYLAPLSAFSDPFEGSLPKTHPESVEHFQKKYDMPDGAIKGYDYHLKSVKKYAYINCWHINEFESAAMWDIYSRTNESVAVQSSFLKLKDEVKNQTFLSSVGYIDYENQFIPQGNMIYHCLFKRMSFSFEQEFKVISYDMPKHMNEEEPVSYKQVNINLENLIENIYISPDAPGYFEDLISSISDKYGYSFNIEKSSIDDTPFY